jgi:hypothetical protein
LSTPATQVPPSPQKESTNLHYPQGREAMRVTEEEPQRLD